MPLFSYKAKDKKGKVVEDVIQADDRKEAAELLKANDLQVLTVKNLESKLNTSIGGGISVSDKATFCRFTATMLRAGLPLTEAVEVIRKETKNNTLRTVLFDISFELRKGSSLSKVLSKYDDHFDSFFITMVKAGEESGTLEKSFDYLSKQLLTSHELNQQIKGSMMYPAVIVIAMFGNAILMLTFVLPKMSEVFTNLNVELPTVTRLVLGFGEFVGDNTILVLAVVLFFVILVFLIFFIKKTRRILFLMALHIPAVKHLMNQIDISRFARTLSTLLRSGVPVMVALDVSAGSLTQPRLKKRASEFSAGVAKGESLSDLLVEGKKVFPSVMIQTIRAGEKSGSLDQVLEELADFYEKEVEFSLKRLTSLLEPVLMLVIGIAVGAMVLIMITPIYSIVGGLEGI